MNYNFGDLIEKVAQSFGIQTCWKCKWRKANANAIGKLIEKAVHEPDLKRRMFLLKTAAAGVAIVIGTRPAWAVNLWRDGMGCVCLPAPINIFNCASAHSHAVRYNYVGGPKPSTNGCTSFPDGFWGGCCDQHDFDFANCAMSIKVSGKRLHNCIDNKCAENSSTPSLYVSCLAMSKSIAWAATETPRAVNAYINEQNRVCGCKTCGWYTPCNSAFPGIPSRETPQLPGLEPIDPIGTGGL